MGQPESMAVSRYACSGYSLADYKFSLSSFVVRVLEMRCQGYWEFRKILVVATLPAQEKFFSLSVSM